jgi:AraC-like DNA-binding protein
MTKSGRNPSELIRSRACSNEAVTSVLAGPVNPMAYLTDWRLRSGARLLRQSDQPLTAVARRVGYSSPFAFATAFRRSYGVPPGRYRTESD